MEHVRSLKCHQQSKSKSVLFAIVVVGLGIALLLRNTGMMDEYVKSIVFSWPMLVVAIGILNLHRYSYGLGILLILFGGFFIIADIYQIPVQFREVFWPSLIIIVGLSLVYAALVINRRKKWVISNSSENRLEEIAVFGGGYKNVQSQSFRGGDLINVFGGSKIDFTHSTLADGTHELNFVSVFGGSTLIFPPDWHVKTEVVSIFGNFTDKRSFSNPEYNKTLIIKGVAIFGGGEIKSSH